MDLGYLPGAWPGGSAPRDYRVEVLPVVEVSGGVFAESPEEALLTDIAATLERIEKLLERLANAAERE